MLNFPDLGHQPEPPMKKMTSEEYLRFCEFCLRNNSRVSSANCLSRKTGEEDIKVPFQL